MASSSAPLPAALIAFESAPARARQRLNPPQPAAQSPPAAPAAARGRGGGVARGVARAGGRGAEATRAVEKAVCFSYTFS